MTGMTSIFRGDNYIYCELNNVYFPGSIRLNSTQSGSRNEDM